MTTATLELQRHMQIYIAITIAVLLLICTIVFAIRAKNDITIRTQNMDKALAIATTIGALSAIFIAWYMWK